MTPLRPRFLRRASDDGLTDEIRAHLAEHVDDLVESGLSEEDARYQAAREFGNVTRHVEDSREVWTTAVGRAAWDVADDIRFALRRVSARPVATLASVITLACSIGAAAATWSLVSSVVLHPLPIRSPETLKVIAGSGVNAPSGIEPHTIYTTYPLVRSAAVFQSLAAGGSWTELVEVNAERDRRRIFFASYDYFDTLGVHLQLGRDFTRDDDRRGAPVVAVLSDRLWSSAFARSPAVLGQAVIINGQRAQIVGVAPRWFRGLTLTEAPDLYMPMQAVEMAATSLMNPFADGNAHYSPTAWVSIVGRLPPGVTEAQAVARLNAATRSTARAPIFALADVVDTAIPAASRTDIRRFTRLLGGAVGLLLLVGCCSVGMLLLVRTEARRDEFAMCLALGATRARLARGVALEGALLACAGALLALPVCAWLLAGVRVFELPGRISVDLLDLHLDARVLAAVIAAAVVATGLIAVIAGALGFSADVARALRARSGATPRVTRRRTRAALVVAEAAVAMVLVSGAGLFARSLIEALRLNPGYDTSRLATGEIDLRPHGYDAARSDDFFRQLETMLLTRPSVRSAALTAPEGGMGPGGTLRFDDVPRRVPSMTEFVGVDEHYFATVGLPLVHGRDFANSDKAGAPRVAIVSASLGRLVAGSGDPTGHHVTEYFRMPGQPAGIIEIVGVVPDVITSVTVAQPLVLYRPIAQSPQQSGTSRTVVLHASTSADATIRDLFDVVRHIDPAVKPAAVMTMDERLLRQMAPQRFGMLVLMALGVVAALLTVLGTSVLAESMAQVRKREMGIRASLGATGRQLGGLVLGETARFVGGGVALGLVLSWLAAGTIRGFLFHVEPLDPTTLGLVAVAILALALAVSLRPALAAMRVDIATTLREE
jgi:putative ABC transport system permease protein